MFKKFNTQNKYIKYNINKKNLISKNYYFFDYFSTIYIFLYKFNPFDFLIKFYLLFHMKY
jgi:hypothetical protein